MVIGGIIGVVMLIAAIFFNYAASNSLERELDQATTTAQEKQTEQDVAIANLATALENQTQQFEACKEHSSSTPIEGCDEPVSDTPEKIVDDTTGIGSVPTVEGKQGIAGRPPTAQEIFGAVESYCASPLLACVGPKGDKGEQGDFVAGDKGDKGDTGLSGRPPTSDEISAAVTAYCAANNNCVGPVGPVGPSGPTGPATGPTDDQVAAAVAAYCAAHNNCTPVSVTPPDPVEPPVDNGRG